MMTEMTYVFDIEDPVVYVCGAGWFNSRYDVQQIEGVVPLRVSDRHVDDFRQGLLANVTTGQVNQIWSTTFLEHLSKREGHGLRSPKIWNYEN